jgi:RNA polymerase sigma factor (sigma-70 family)
MKEIEITVRMRNNRLKERREMLGMSQSEIAKAAGVCLSSYGKLEAMRLSPRIDDHGSWHWREIALKLARFHCVEPEELFPQTVMAVGTPVAIRRVNGSDIFPILSAHQERLLESPDVAIERTEIRERVQHALASLPPREAKVLRLRFGLDDGVERTLKEIGAELGVCGTRAQEIEVKALRMLMNPRRGLIDLAFRRRR